MVCFLMQPRRLSAFFVTRTPSWLMFSFCSATRTPQVLFFWATPNLYCWLRLFFPRCKTWHFALLKCRRFLLPCFSSMSRSFWMEIQPTGVAATSPNFVLSTNLQKARSVLPSRSLMKILNSIDCWGTPLVTGLQLGFCHWSEPLNLAAQPVFSLSYCLSSQHFTPLAVRMLCVAVFESLTEVKVNNLHFCSCPPSQSPHCRWLLRSSRISPFLNHLLVLRMLGNVFQDYLLLHPPRDCGEADQNVVPQISLSFLKIRVTCAFFSVPRNLPQKPWPFKDNWDCLSNDINKLCQYLRLHAVGFQVFCVCPVCFNVS